MTDPITLGERFASLESKVTEISAREENAAKDRHRAWEMLSLLRDEVKFVSAQQQGIVSRLESVGQMAQVAKDFVAAAREIPTRTEFALLKNDVHTTDIKLAQLTTEFNMVKEARDATVNRMWAVISTSLATGIISAFGWIVNFMGKHP